jgi:FKBP-type peptidyl-prolyl cis-trans isomerase
VGGGVTVRAARRARALALVLAMPLTMTGAVGGCRGKRAAPPVDNGGDAGATTAAPPPVVRKVERPPLPLAPPPADAEIITGLVEAPAARVHKRTLRAGAGPRPGRNDTVGLLLTGWRPSGEVFLSTAERKRPVQKSLATMAPGFVAAVQTMQVGEQAMMWIPTELSYPGTPPEGAEPTVYRVELVSVDPAPPVPPDVAAPPATAVASPSGLRSLVIRPGTGAVRPRPHDHVVFHYTAWDATGRLVDSSEVRGRPSDSVGFRHSRGLEEVLGLMVVGERRRAWLPVALLDATGPNPPTGPWCYEVQLESVERLPAPPPAPPRTPPAAAATTADGTRWVTLAAGRGGATPGDDERVSLEFSAWQADGRLFDSSVPFGRTLDAPVRKLYASWIPVVKAMTPGQRVRLWVPAPAAAAAAPDKPGGALIFELELVATGPAARPVAPPVPPVPLVGVDGGAP